jgi:hypothetical protein
MRQQIRRKKTRKQRAQKGGSTRQMSLRVFLNPQGTERIRIHYDMTQEQFLELLTQVGDYLQGFSAEEGKGFLLTYPVDTINYEINEPDARFTHVQVLLPQREIEEIDFPPGLSYRLEQVLLPVDVEGARYYITFSYT